MNNDTVIATCPSCKREHEDHDGFGVLYCAYCRYCSHASISSGQCDFCWVDEAVLAKESTAAKGEGK